MTAYIFDTDVASDILGGDATAVELLEKLQEEDAGHLLLISEITRAEMLSIPSMTPTLALSIEKLVECFDDVIAVDEVVSRTAAELRRESNGPSQQCEVCKKRTGGRLKMPDSIVAATAATEEAILITRNYRDYQKIHEAGLVQVLDPASALRYLTVEEKASAKPTE